MARDDLNDIKRKLSTGNILEKLHKLEREQRYRDLRKKRIKIEEEKRKESGDKKSLLNNIKFNVKKIMISKSKILSKKEIRNITRQYEGRKLSIGELKEVVLDINNLYKKKGSASCLAILPPQKISKGVVKILLVEGKLETVKFKGNKYTSTSYLKESFPIIEGDFINLKDIENHLLYFNKTNKSASIVAKLSPGTKIGFSNISINISEIPRYSAGVYLDNKGSQSTGFIRYGVTFLDRALFGIDDLLSLGITKTAGSISGFASYEVPVNDMGTRIKLLYSRIEQDIIGGVFETLNVAGSSVAVSGSFIQPIYVDKSWKIESSYEYIQNINNTTLNQLLNKNIFYKHSLGVNVGRQDFSGVWLGDFKIQRFTSSSILNHIKTIGEFTKYSFDIIRRQKIAYNINLTVNLNGQLSGKNGNFPIIEQFQLGGRNNLAYQSGLVSGDKGYVLDVKAEYAFDPSFQIYSFFQYGVVFPYYRVLDGEDEIQPEDTATSIGFGFKKQLYKQHLGIEGTTAIGLSSVHEERHHKYNLFQFTIQAGF